jgi:hypothetical protein
MLDLRAEVTKRRVERAADIEKAELGETSGRGRWIAALASLSHAPPISD